MTLSIRTPIAQLLPNRAHHLPIRLRQLRQRRPRILPHDRAVTHMPSIPRLLVLSPAHRTACFHGRGQGAQVEVHAHPGFPGQVEVPVRRGDEEPAAYYVAQQGRDEGVPDVVADGEGGAAPDALGDEEPWYVLARGVRGV